MLKRNPHGTHTPTAGVLTLSHRGTVLSGYYAWLCVADVDGGMHSVGDAGTLFSIQSISKAFVYALVCEALGHRSVGEIVRVNNTGLAFDSVIATVPGIEDQAS